MDQPSYSSNQRVYSSPEELRSFISSQIWNDLSADIQTWIVDIQEQLEVVEDTSILRRLQGNIEACRRFLDLPRVLLEHAELENVTRSRR